MCAWCWLHVVQNFNYSVLIYVENSKSNNCAQIYLQKTMYQRIFDMITY